MVGAGAEEIRCRGEDEEDVTLPGWMMGDGSVRPLLLCPRDSTREGEVSKHHQRRLAGPKKRKGKRKATDAFPRVWICGDGRCQSGGIVSKYLPEARLDSTISIRESRK